MTPAERRAREQSLGVLRRHYLRMEGSAPLLIAISLDGFVVDCDLLTDSEYRDLLALSATVCQ